MNGFYVSNISLDLSYQQLTIGLFFNRSIVVISLLPVPFWVCHSYSTALNWVIWHDHQAHKSMLWVNIEQFILYETKNKTASGNLKQICIA